MAEPGEWSGAPGHTLCDYDACDQEPTVTLPRGAVMCEHHAAVALLAGMSAGDAASTFRFARPVPETTPPDFGVEHRLLVDWINSLPEPFRGFVHALETNADPSGNIRDAVCWRDTAEALAKRVGELNESNDCFMRSSELANAEADSSKARVGELEAQRKTRDARIAEAVTILATPGTWSDFAARARKALTDG